MAQTTSATAIRQELLNTIVKELRLLTRLGKRRMRDCIANEGLTVPQWRLLNQLSRLGSSTQANLSHLLDADPMTIGGIIARSEKQGLIFRANNAADRRSKLVQLTAAGQLALETSNGVKVALADIALLDFSEEELAAFSNSLHRARRNLAPRTHASRACGDTHLQGDEPS